MFINNSNDDDDDDDVTPIYLIIKNEVSITRAFLNAYL